MNRSPDSNPSRLNSSAAARTSRRKHHNSYKGTGQRDIKIVAEHSSATEIHILPGRNNAGKQDRSETRRRASALTVHFRPRQMALCASEPFYESSFRFQLGAKKACSVRRREALLLNAHAAARTSGHH
jgi:hypothetical protein